MRIGFNPNKDKLQISNDFFHQVIVPVYIPDQEGYFKESLEILRYCLESLFKTSHNKTYFTIVNNGSCDEVVDYLNALYQENKIQELIHTTNIGKINAILKGITGHQFPLITITDADVLFLNDWQQATYQIFETFPKAGAVCPTPSSRSFNYKTYNVLFENFFSKTLQFTKVKNPEALQAFARSIGSPGFYKKQHLDKYLTITKGACKAVIGAGHFATTYRFAVFENQVTSYSGFSLGGDSENKILDAPVIYNGLWRLSTEDNYAYHMGNVSELWMKEIFSQLRDSNYIPDMIFDFKKVKETKFEFWIKNVFFAKLLNQGKIKRWFLQYKGLTRNDAAKY
jgi:glycosyltransferase involved in cell wall biosynthesis